MKQLAAILAAMQLSSEDLKTFCHKWQIVEFSVFGSVLRDDFRPDSSDLDVLVRFAPDAPWTLLDLVIIQNELQAIVNREVDLIEKQVIEKSDNWIRRNEILNTAQILYSNTYEVA